MKIMTTNPIPPDLLLPDSVVNADREAFIERITQLVCDLLRDSLTDILSESRWSPEPEDLWRSAGGASTWLEQVLCSFQFQGISKCNDENPHQDSRRCEPCHNQKQCLHLTGAGKMFKELTGAQITNICNYFRDVFTSTVKHARDSSVKQTIPSHSAESNAVTPPGTSELPAPRVRARSSLSILGMLPMSVFSKV